MKNLKVESKPQATIDSITCDVCKTTYSFKGEEVFEAQEVISIDTRGGYGSIFGDMSTIELDICQHCFKKKFDEYIRIDGVLEDLEPEFPETEVIANINDDCNK